MPFVKRRILLARRRILLGLLLVGALVTAVLVGVPVLGRWYVTRRVLPGLEQAFSREISVGAVSVRLGAVRLEDVRVQGTLDRQGQPLATIPRLLMDYAVTPLLRGRLVARRVLVERPRLNLSRGATGKSNFLDLLRRRSQGKTGGRLRLEALEVQDGALTVVDEVQRLGVSVDKVDGVLHPGGSAALRLRALEVTSPRMRSGLSLAQVDVEVKELRRGASLTAAAPRLRVSGGEVQLLPHLGLSAIQGRAYPDAQGQNIRIELAGSYGGAEAKLWSATGWLGADLRHGELRVRAARFSLGRIASILQRSPVIQPQSTLVDAQLDLFFAPQRLRFAGHLQVERLSLFHPRLSRTPVLDLSGLVELGGQLELGEPRLDLQRLRLQSRGAEAQLSGSIARLSTEPLITLRMVVPPIPCQQVLAAFPPALLPQLQGFELKGDFELDLAAKIDYRDLENLELGGKVGINRCKVVTAPPEVSAERLQAPFEHLVEPVPQQQVAMLVGPENQEFTPYAEISPHLINAFLTTEDGGFFRHRGFIPSMFGKALARNLQRSGFRLGASTISMQMVKNVLLDQQKTLSRKLQELFLTWYLEQSLPKDRIMEIYLNVIEFGPAIYGIGAAAQHFFGTKPRELTPLEAAFFASVLPSPKARYVQYCHGRLTEKWDRYVKRILRRMAEKGFISEKTLAESEGQTLAFRRDLKELSEEQCLENVKTLLDDWQAERERRLREDVTNAAPHQLELHLGKSSAEKEQRPRPAPEKP